MLVPVYIGMLPVWDCHGYGTLPLVVEYIIEFYWQHMGLMGLLRLNFVNKNPRFLMTVPDLEVMH